MRFFHHYRRLTPTRGDSPPSPGFRFSVLCLVILLLAVPAGVQASDLVDINTASAAELAEHLPGIGPVKAQAIVDYREANGPFRTVEALVNVSGIGPATMDTIRPFVTVSDVDVSADAGDSLSEPMVASSGSTSLPTLTSEQKESMARAATRAAIRLAIEDARAAAASSVNPDPSTLSRLR